MYEPPLPRADSRFAKPRNSLQGRTGLFFLLLQKEPKSTRSVPPDRGKLSACQKVPERETDCYFLRRAKSNTKSTRGKPCDLGSNRRPSHYFDRFSSFRQITGYVQTTILQKIDGNDLNRCELQALHKRICNFVQVHSGFFGKQ